DSNGLLAGVALGGRASLLGPAVGALLVGYAETSLSEAFPGSWSYFQGALFVLVILLLPGGLAQLLGLMRGLVSRRTESTSSGEPETRVAEEVTA
ncbi:urea ABC transporter permease subunit UrtC, partial [Nocardioides sp. NPDC000441]